MTRARTSTVVLSRVRERGHNPESPTSMGHLLERERGGLPRIAFTAIETVWLSGPDCLADSKRPMPVELGYP